MLRSIAVRTGGGVETQEIKESAKINCSTHGWRCSLKRERKRERERDRERERENEVLTITKVLTGGDVDSRVREGTKC